MGRGPSHPFVQKYGLFTNCEQSLKMNKEELFQSIPQTTFSKGGISSARRNIVCSGCSRNKLNGRKLRAGEKKQWRPAYTSTSRGQNWRFCAASDRRATALPIACRGLALQHDRPLRGPSALAYADRFAGSQHVARNPCSTLASHPAIAVQNVKLFLRAS